jgi:hypothetical protein
VDPAVGLLAAERDAAPDGARRDEPLTSPLHLPRRCAVAENFFVDTAPSFRRKRTSALRRRSARCGPCPACLPACSFLPSRC